MEFATGAMGTLIPKLGELLLDEYNLKDTVKKGIGDLKAELESMQGVLVKVSSVPLDELDLQVKIWANEVRELSYIIEDSFDSFVTRVEGVEPTKSKFNHLLKKARNKFTKFKARHVIANEIEDIESQVRKIKERYDRYKIHDVVANLATTTVDPRLSALYNKVSDLVGTEEPIDELMKILSEGAETAQKNPKIVSIVGFGGLGKTTLAKALFDKLSKTYDRQGFVPVGQNQGAKKVLSDILFELDIEVSKRMDERQLINKLQNVLAGKRYFIVIDDLWDIPTWETIKYAFMDSHPESRIMITTRNHDVATNAGGIYRMKPLSNGNSKMLFHTRTCGAEGVSQDDQSSEVINKILKKCAGVPLAIISIASLLVGKPSADWSRVYDAIGFGNEDSEVIHNTRKILSFSYYDLRPYLKTCLLYLGMYPEDKFIHKKSLIWRWVSEGFVQHKQGISSYELGESYYNELVNKSLIREVDYGYNVDDEGCRVHDMVLDVIRIMSMEVNFITIQDKGEDHIKSSPKGQSNRVHRLAFHGAKVEDCHSIKMKHVRSFNAIMCTDTGMPPFLTFKVLRVLVIEDCIFSEGLSLKHLGKLVQLRYLGLVNTSVKLPGDIGLDLKFLEILGVRGGSISELPPSVGELQNLRCLWANEGTTMKGEIGKLTCLEEMKLDSVDKVPNFFRDVGKLTKLRVLEISLDQLEESACKVLAEYMLNLHKIRRIFIENKWKGIMHFDRNVCVGSLEELSPSSSLRTFWPASILITKIPSWINALSVPLLSQLLLHVEVVEAQDIQILGRLPSLIDLGFFIAEKKCVSYTFGRDEFQKLKCLATNVEINLEEGSLPMLESLAYCASAGRKDSLVPWNNSWPSLCYVCCWLDCANSGRTEVKAAKAALRKAGRAMRMLGSTRIHFHLDIYIQRYNRKAAGLIDALESILAGEEITADQRELRRMITSLETLLRDNDEPQLGRYGEQELSGFVTKFKSLLHHDDSGTDQEEPDNSDTMATYDDTDTDDENHHREDGDNGDNDYDTEQDEADNDVATSSGSH
uniref:Uncharacterized protein n=3 Tax=Avena sativa TaxID=4498 RepID=A0ACD5ZCG0_AVESA